VTPTEQPVFYYDLGSPSCYLVAEQVTTALAVVPEWEPVRAADIVTSSTNGRLDRAGIERAAAALGIQPLRWPEPWPPDTRFALLAATYAKRVGRAVAFSLAAFRQTFAAGRDLGDESTVLIAAAACELHPAALLKGARMRSVSDALDQAGARARLAGVEELPAIQFGERVFSGMDALEEAR
jgi:2-hydroxychromene-2-carboxylate isomerase